MVDPFSNPSMIGLMLNKLPENFFVYSHNVHANPHWTSVPKVEGLSFFNATLITKGTIKFKLLVFTKSETLWFNLYFIVHLSPDDAWQFDSQKRAWTTRTHQHKDKPR